VKFGGVRIITYLYTMEEFETQYGVTYMGDVQNGEEEEFWVDGEGLVELCNEDTYSCVDVATPEGALDFLREVGYSIRVEKIPVIDSAGFDSEGINHYQEKLNFYKRKLD